jgi:tRNA modification GTPase
MFSAEDTIVAIATPAGRGGLGVVRISGPGASGVAARMLEREEPLQPRYATFTKVRDVRSSHPTQVVDEVIATWFPAPHSYTGEHVVEVSTHGSPVILDAVLRSAIHAGARLARPGEFTFRAYLNGKLDLVQAEAVADLIDAVTPLQARVAFDQLEGTLTTKIRALDSQLFDLIARVEASLDFPDEGYHFINPQDIVIEIAAIVDRLDGLLHESARGRVIRDGATVVITGRANVGKSSLFNALVGHGRAIVDESAGTTRDLVSETIDLQGLAVRLVDTAGIRETNDRAEREGVWRATRARDSADLLVLVFDVGEALTIDDEQLLEETAGRRRVIVANKCDRAPAWERTDWLQVSAATGARIEELRNHIVLALTGDDAHRDTTAITNMRHVTLLIDTRGALVRARAAVEDMHASEEFVLADLHAARASLGEVVGTRASDDVLQHIFERFCIGK